MKIVFVEDNPDFREEISFQLRHLGHEVIDLDCGQALLDWLGPNAMPDIFLLDVGLPDRDGLELARTIRAGYPGYAIVMLTARAAVDQRIDGWESGADAYLTKPVHFRELVAIMRSLVLRYASFRPIDTGQWTLDVRKNRLLNPAGEACDLSVTECRLLQCLVESNGHPVERNRLVLALGEQPWSYDMRRLEAQASRLRKKFSQLGSTEPSLRPVRGRGYQLTERIRLRQDDPEDS